MEAMEELSQLSKSIRQAASLLADDSAPRRPSTFLNIVVLGNVGFGKSVVLNSLVGHPVLDRLNKSVSTISVGSVFNCDFFSRNSTVFYWGDEIVSGVIGLAPRNVKFQSIGEGGYHVCGVLENAQVFC
ncbi:putative receptor protein kinase CRINKLY4 [Hordeum vulgare]|nr:putative receptor protein kinase CRINKLY4 [Hordeum vulgare]